MTAVPIPSHRAIDHSFPSILIKHILNDHTAMSIKKITRPDIKDAVRLSPREMNALHFSQKHTILTPDRLKTAPNGNQ